MEYIRTAGQAEDNAAAQMRALGYVDARAVPAGRDGGIDVVSAGALAQVKWKSSVAGRPELQRLYGARADDLSKDLLFFASAGYSDPALSWADLHNMSLFTYEPTGQIVPANGNARRLVESLATPLNFGQHERRDEGEDPTNQQLPTGPFKSTANIPAENLGLKSRVWTALLVVGGICLIAALMASPPRPEKAPQWVSFLGVLSLTLAITAMYKLYRLKRLRQLKVKHASIVRTDLLNLCQSNVGQFAWCSDVAPLDPGSFHRRMRG